VREDRGTPIYDRERDTKKPLYNGKVVCVDNVHNLSAYTIGKIYQFVEGRITTNEGYKLPFDSDPTKIYSFEDWSKFTSSKFIEIVE
jgi:hypothetical protein